MRKSFICFLATALCLCMLPATALADRIGKQNDVIIPYNVVEGGYNVTEVPVVPVYCFYSAYMRDYMWTASEDERQQLEYNYYSGKETYQYQGVSGYAELTPSDQNIPVYRFWNKKTTDHFYTTSENEKNQLARDLETGKDDYVYEGIAWYVPKGSSCPVYRFFDTAAFNHFYTSDEQLKDSLSQSYLNGTGTYRYEGIAWYWYN